MGHSITLRVDDSALAALGHALGDFFAAEPLAERVRTRLRLILEELATNTLDYGQCTGSCVEIGLRREGDVLLIDYRDHGIAFDPTCETPAEDIDAPLDERRIGGLGWPLIRGFCLFAEYRRDGDANCLRLALPVAI